tara:strand:- start:609 stop:959 length:351 start_codon:yes stop_codon:yes gene_type:complete
MAKAFKGPEEIVCEVDYANFDPKQWQENEAEYEAKLKAFCLETTVSKTGNLIGEVVKTGVADGYACYMVVNTSPLELIHMEVGDAWHADNVWMRGLRVSDVKKQIEGAKKMVSIFG